MVLVSSIPSTTDDDVDYVAGHVPALHPRPVTQFRYTCRSWTEPNTTHHLTIRIDGAEMVIACTCPAGQFGSGRPNAKPCRHVRLFRRLYTVEDIVPVREARGVDRDDPACSGLFRAEGC